MQAYLEAGKATFDHMTESLQGFRQYHAECLRLSPNRESHAHIKVELSVKRAVFDVFDAECLRLSPIVSHMHTLR